MTPGRALITSVQIGITIAQSPSCRCRCLEPMGRSTCSSRTSICNESDFRLFIGWLTAVRRPLGPYPPLVLQRRELHPSLPSCPCMDSTDKRFRDKHGRRLLDQAEVYYMTERPWLVAIGQACQTFPISPPTPFKSFCHKLFGRNRSGFRLVHRHHVTLCWIEGYVPKIVISNYSTDTP